MNVKGREAVLPLWTGRVFHLELIRPAILQGGLSMRYLVPLIIGGIGGWLAGLIVRGAGFGLIGNVVLGIIGALVADWLFSQLNMELFRGTIGSIINSAIGATVILAILSVIRRV